MKQKWMIRTKKADFFELAERYKISPVVARLMINRDVPEDKFDIYLNGDETYMYDGSLLKDLDKAVEILKEKIADKKKIRVVGDYDIDGVCATYILTDVIGFLGGDVDMQIPERIRDGYGINNDIIKKAIADGVDTIITCDNGIAAVDSAKLAKENSITYIITDHHEVPYEEISCEKKYLLPDADAIINHRQADCRYPFKGLCGGAVAYKVAEKLVNNKEKTKEYLMFAAIATIGDVMILQDENRVIVKKGLELIRKTDHIGLNALIEEVKIEKERIDAYHIGFIIGPCINASGRLETADIAYRLLKSESYTQAKEYAKELVELNEKRKELTVQQTEKAIEEAGITTDKVLVLYLPECHESIAGIVAGRIRESLNKPVFVVTDAEEGLKGSGRSIEAYDMYAEMTKHNKYFVKYGGHKMAAGFSFANRSDMESFRKEINEDCTLTEEDFVEKVSIDMVIPFDKINYGLLDELDKIAPFGNGNEKPLFAAKNVQILKMSLIGKAKNMLSMQVTDGTGYNMKALNFGDASEFIAFLKDKFGEKQVENAFLGKLNDITVNMTFYPSVNVYNGTKSINIIMGHYC